MGAVHTSKLMVALGLFHLTHTRHMALTWQIYIQKRKKVFLQQKVVTSRKGTGTDFKSRSM